jgi:hypothetical protein
MRWPNNPATAQTGHREFSNENKQLPSVPMPDDLTFYLRQQIDAAVFNTVRKLKDYKTQFATHVAEFTNDR